MCESELPMLQLPKNTNLPAEQHLDQFIMWQLTVKKTTEESSYVEESDDNLQKLLIYDHTLDLYHLRFFLVTSHV